MMIEADTKVNIFPANKIFFRCQDGAAACPDHARVRGGDAERAEARVGAVRGLPREAAQRRLEAGGRQGRGGGEGAAQGGRRAAAGVQQPRTGSTLTMAL